MTHGDRVHIPFTPGTWEKDMAVAMRKRVSIPEMRKSIALYVKKRYSITTGKGICRREVTHGQNNRNRQSGF